MPFIRITTFGTDLHPLQISRLQQVTTDLMLTTMRKPLAGIAVLVDEVRHGAWCIAGASVPVGAHVEASVGKGQNTPAEKAEFISGMMAVLREVLGDGLGDGVGESTYVALHEFDFDSYGRGGFSRAARERGAPAA